MRVITYEEMKQIVADHQLWLDGKGGKQADFSRSYLCAAQLPNVNLSHANFKEAVLRTTNFSGANLESANFEGANLRFTAFDGANLRSADMSYCDAAFASFANAYVDRCNVAGTDFSQADVQGVDFRCARNVDMAIGLPPMRDKSEAPSWDDDDLER